MYEDLDPNNGISALILDRWNKAQGIREGIRFLEEKMLIPESSCLISIMKKVRIDELKRAIELENQAKEMYNYLINGTKNE